MSGQRSVQQRRENVSYLEFVGPPGSGKTTAALGLLSNDRTLAPGRRSIASKNASVRVNRFGLPAEGLSMWLRLVIGLPRDLAMAALFFRETAQLRRSLTMLVLLIKSRALAVSSQRWVVDQGLQQHILSALADQCLSQERALEWKRLCLGAPWGAERLIAIAASSDELIHRVKNSSKHMRQCAGKPPEKYVGKNCLAFEILFQERGMF